MHLVDGITRILEEDQDCVVAAMDLSAAFDTVDHEILLEKLEKRVGLRGAALGLIQNYLQGRQQALTAAFDDGTKHRITKGPKNECRIQVEGVEWTAETVYKRHIFWRDGESTVKWTKHCGQPHLTGDSDSESDTGKLIPFKAHIKVLGMHIDSRLAWKQHCSVQAATTRRELAKVERACKHLWRADRILMVQALALPHVKHNQEVFAAATKSGREKLRRAYNACARTAAGTEHSDEALEQLGWPSYEDQLAASQVKFAKK
eukprot:gene8853-8385_t